MVRRKNNLLEGFVGVNGDFAGRRNGRYRLAERMEFN